MCLYARLLGCHDRGSYRVRGCTPGSSAWYNSLVWSGTEGKREDRGEVFGFRLPPIGSETASKERDRAHARQSM